MNKRQPTKKEFLDYAHSKKIDVDCAAYQWEAWRADGWRDGRGFAIISWKQKLLTFAKYHFGMFRTVDRERGTRRTDEVEHKRRMAAEVDRINREDEEREKRKRRE